MIPIVQAAQLDKHGGHVTFQGYAGVGRKVRIVLPPPPLVGYKSFQPYRNITLSVMTFYHVKHLIVSHPIPTHHTPTLAYVMQYYPTMPIMPKKHLEWVMPTCVPRNWHPSWEIHCMRVMSSRHPVSI